MSHRETDVEYQHKRNYCLWVTGALDRLFEAGVVPSFGIHLNIKGISEFDQLHAGGFRPHVTEIDWACEQICQTVPTAEERQWVYMLAADHEPLLQLLEKWELSDEEAR